jgi:hypothetical protein
MAGPVARARSLLTLIVLAGIPACVADTVHVSSKQGEASTLPASAVANSSQQQAIPPGYKAAPANSCSFDLDFTMRHFAQQENLQVQKEHSYDPSTGAVKDTLVLIKSRDASPAFMQFAGQTLGAGLDLAKLAIGLGVKGPGPGTGGQPGTSTGPDSARIMQEEVDRRVAAAVAAANGQAKSTACVIPIPAGG